VSIGVLFVCTGNICRSPVAERLAAARSVAPAEYLWFSSAGTHAVEGLGIDLASALALRELGGDPDGHASARLTGAMLESAALILTATTEHRDFSLRKRPSGLRKAFTLKEFVRLGHDVTPANGPDDVARVIAEVAGQRGLVHPGGPVRDDIADPFGARSSDAMRAAVEASLAVDGLLRLLGVNPKSEQDEVSGSDHR
jgi:protein-tyrosine phosphatase